MFLKLLTACTGLKRMLPEGPVFSAEERTAWLAKADTTVVYSGAPKVNHPILPVQVWAATYELDLILVSKHPDWNMHEYAKLETPQGDLWIMKDAEEGSLDQYITADLPDIQAWLPELPVVRRSYPVKIVDKSTAKQLDFEFEYENIKGEQIKATYKGKYPKTALKKRNGSTMGHSKNQLLVALDLPYRDFGKKASVSYNGEAYKMDKLLGLVPFQMALKQTQGGASSGNFSIQAQPAGFSTTHPKAAEQVSQSWTVKTEDGYTLVQQSNDFRSLNYKFKGEPNESLELEEAWVQQWNKTASGVRLVFAPAVPDLRRPFEGVQTINFVLDIAGQSNKAKGQAKAYWKDGKAYLDLFPEAPWWVLDRPMRTVVEYKENISEISIEMLE